MSDEMQAALVLAFGAFALSLLAVAFLSWICNFFVALQSLPRRRAIWTVGIAYLLASFGMLFSEMEGFEWFLPLTNIPGAICVYLYYKRQYEYSWVDSPLDIPDGVSLANDDWRSGLVVLVVLIAIFIARVVFRFLAEPIN